MITDLTAFLAAAQARVNADYGHHINAHGEVMQPPTLSIETGRKYARIVADNGSQRQAFGFVDLTNGSVLMAASWSTPAKNFARGNINDGNNGCTRMRWTGVH